MILLYDKRNYAHVVFKKIKINLYFVEVECIVQSMLLYRCYIFIVERKIHLETIKALDYLLAAAALLIHTALVNYKST